MSVLQSPTPSPTPTKEKNSFIAAIESLQPKQVFLATLVVLAMAFTIFVMVRYRLVIFGLFEAIVFSAGLRPIVQWLNSKGIPRPAAAALVFLAILILVIVILILIIPMMVETVPQLTTTVNNLYANFRKAITESHSQLFTYFGSLLPQSLQSGVAPAPAPTNGQTMEKAGQYGASILRAIFVTIMILLLTFYLTVDRQGILMGGLAFLSVESRERVKAYIDKIESMVSDYLRGQLILCASIGVLSLIAYLLIGLPNVIVLAIFAGIMEAVPLIGPVLGAVPAILIALTISPTKVIWVIVTAVIIQQLENNLLVPRIMKQSVGVSPVITLLAFVFFSSLFGMAGGLLAIPLAASIILTINQLTKDSKTRAEAEQVQGRKQLDVLLYESQDLINDMGSQRSAKDTDDNAFDDEIELEMESIAIELNEILSAVDKQTTDVEGEQDV